MKALRSLFPLLLVGLLLPGCDSGGGPKVLRIYFGTNHFGTCDFTSIDVDLEDAGVELARLAGGEPDCDLSAQLEAAGCDIDFTEISGGAVLHVAISDCIIPEEVRLFDCGFRSPDVEKLQASVSASCNCAEEPVCSLNDAFCDRTPYLCVSPTDSPTACENCDNDIDDDGNGLSDCDDPHCDSTRECGYHRSSSTVTCTTPTTVPVTTTNTVQLTTTTFTTTSTLVPPPTTTLPPDTTDYSVRFRLDTASASIGALQWTVDYATAPGSFAGSGALVNCSNLVSGALFAPNDDEANEKLTLGLIALTPFAAPLDLVTCVFNGVFNDLPNSGHFPITIDDATDGEGGTVTVTITTSITALP